MKENERKKKSSKNRANESENLHNTVLFKSKIRTSKKNKKKHEIT